MPKLSTNNKSSTSIVEMEGPGAVPGSFFIIIRVIPQKERIIEYTMKITKVEIEKFRGFEQQSFEMGSLITAIAGQNGTQKSTLLGIITQTFTLSKENPMVGERPLCGGDYRSSFSEKFRLSPNFDKPKSHEWTLKFDEHEDYTVTSYPRKGSEIIRFWTKGKRESGDGYIQYPTIFLSLKRLIPLAEDLKVKADETILTADERLLFEQLHNEILIIVDGLKISETKNVTSSSKQTVGVNTDLYDWNQNSIGQGNIGTILLALISFQRLKTKYPNDYKGGILAIDELDAAMYPASQLKLLKVLRKYASKLNLQIVFTTHSITMLEGMYKMQKEVAESRQEQLQVQTIYLKKYDHNIRILSGVALSDIKDNLLVAMGESPKKTKILTYVEDPEAEDFAKAILKKRKKHLPFEKAKLGCSQYVDLSARHIPAFNKPQCIIILDGDVKEWPLTQRRRLSSTQNILLLPGVKSIERLLANYLYNLSDTDSLWESIGHNYSKQICFLNYSPQQIENDREIAKKWYLSQKDRWGTNSVRVINPLMQTMSEDLDNFLSEFDQLISGYLID